MGNCCQFHWYILHANSSRHQRLRKRAYLLKMLNLWAEFNLLHLHFYDDQMENRLQIPKRKIVNDLVVIEITNFIVALFLIDDNKCRKNIFTTWLYTDNIYCIPSIVIIVIWLRRWNIFILNEVFGGKAINSRVMSDFYLPIPNMGWCVQYKIIIFMW